MKKFFSENNIVLFFALVLLSSLSLSGQTFNNPGGTITTCSGIFYDTGGSGGDYSNNENVTTTFCSATPGEAIQLDFTSFELEGCCDFLTIFDGPTTASPSLGSYNGTNTPGTVTASGECITIRFTSDGSVVRPGWAATISCVTPPPPSTNYNNPGGTITTCSGTFYDAGGSGGNYSNNENITTTFCSATPGEAIQLDFTSFELEGCCDFLTIFDGPTTASPSLGSYNGTNTPGTVTASGECITIRFTSDGSVVRPGWAATISCVTPPPPSTNYNNPGGTITTCSGIFYDTGGSGGDYSYNENVTTTFCSATPGEAIQLDFTSFDLETCCDEMIIYDGPNTASAMWGIFTTNPGTITGSGECLTVVFTSDGSITYDGWEANISCVTPGPPPPPSPPQDCPGAIQICNDNTFSGNSSGSGVPELNASNSGCLYDENQSSWYFFVPTTSGTLELTINTSVDYDFAIWTGATVSCANLGSPVRCSYSADYGPTGLGNGASDTSEDSGGDAWVAPLSLVQDQFYIMIIDNYTADGTSFDIDFNFSTPNLLDCTPITLPVELLDFTAHKLHQSNTLNWSTATERNNDYFVVQRSIDGLVWETIGIVEGNGTTNQTSYYSYDDENIVNGITYYRLKQVDYDGQFSYSMIRSVSRLSEQEKTTVYPMPNSGDFSVSSSQEIKRMNITDLAGRTIEFSSQVITDLHYSVKLTSVSSGMYNLEIVYADDYTETLKFIVE